MIGLDRFTDNAKKLLDGAMREALQLGQANVGPEHILLALLREEDGLLSKILAPAALRRHVIASTVRLASGNPARYADGYRVVTDAHIAIFSEAGTVIEHPLSCQGGACRYADAVRNFTDDEPMPADQWGPWLIENVDEEGACSLTRLVGSNRQTPAGESLVAGIRQGLQRMDITVADLKFLLEGDR